MQEREARFDCADNDAAGSDYDDDNENDYDHDYDNDNDDNDDNDHDYDDDEDGSDGEKGAAWLGAVRRQCRAVASTNPDCLLQQPVENPPLAALAAPFSKGGDFRPAFTPFAKGVAA